MNNKIVIHVGFPKTATSFLQKMIFPELKEVCYIGRPYTQENEAFNTIQYADRSLYSEALAQEEINRIVVQAGNKNILISDELFAGYGNYNFINRGQIAERFSRLMPNAEIVVFLRGQKDLILSLYGQYLKMGWFSQALDDSFLSEPGSGFSLEEWESGKRQWTIQNRFISHQSKLSTEHFRYSKLYELYSSLFKKVHVFLYEELKTNQQRSVERLVSIVSPGQSISLSHVVNKTINKSLSKKELHAKLWENKFTNAVSSVRLRRLVATAMSKIKPDHHLENETYVVKLLKKTAIFEDNQKLNEQYGLGMEKYPEKYFEWHK